MSVIVETGKKRAWINSKLKIVSFHEIDSLLRKERETMWNRNFIMVVIGQIISLFGNAIQRFSMSLYLLEFTGSTAAFSKILA